MRRKTLTIAILFLCAYFSLQAKDPIKFGKVSLAELEMNKYEPDTAAAAVILCKYGYFNGNDMTFTQIKRVKILKKTAVNMAELSFPGPEDMEVRGKVYNLVDGKIKEDKLKSESKYKVRIVGDWYNVRVALPNVKVGSVFDIITTQFLLPREFLFQENIPIKYVELKLESSINLNYRKRSVGYHNIEQIGTNGYKAKNVPAFISEPYIDSKRNYLSKFEFDIKSYNFYGSYKEFTTTWSAVNSSLQRNFYFGSVIKQGYGFINKLSKEIEEKYSSDADKVRAAYDAIKKMNWDGRNSIYVSKFDLNTTYKAKSGNSADINLMLCKLIKKLDIQAHPVVTSTRANGLLHPVYPSFDKLNYVIVQVNVGGELCFLDATDKNLPFGMLPKRCMNKRGRIVNNDQGFWVDIVPKEKHKEVYQYGLELSSDEKLSGNLTIKKLGYAALNFRNKYTRYTNEDEYVVGFEERYDGVRVLNYRINNLDSINMPIEECISIGACAGVQHTGELVMVHPFFYQQKKHNPFNSEQRLYPVDFAFMREELVDSRITIPLDYDVVGVPESLRIKLPNNSASVLISYAVLGNVISAVYNLRINKDLFLPDEYENLKQLYALIIQKHSEPLILKKNQDEAKL